MSNLINLNEIERKAYMSFFEDGLVDLLIGLWILGIGLLMHIDQAAFMGVLVIVLFPVWGGLKRLITIPRIGVVNLSQSHKTRLFQRRGMFALLLGIVLFVNVAIFIGAKNMTPDLQELMRQYVDIFFCFLIALMIFVGALLLDVNRWFVHAGVLMAVAIVGEWLALELPLRLVVTGAIVFLIGLGILMQFIRNNPIPEGAV